MRLIALPPVPKPPYTALHAVEFVPVPMITHNTRLGSIINIPSRQLRFRLFVSLTFASFEAIVHSVSALALSVLPMKQSTR
ncbi:hypothetical protein BDZ91DRAFT_716877 [Kalaharituber pfeilii]|nr:hypothetical protein BDZ91DRAFT_716877 [Kalaharituber pfeilii]